MSDEVTNDLVNQQAKPKVDTALPGTFSAQSLDTPRPDFVIDASTIVEEGKLYPSDLSNKKQGWERLNSGMNEILAIASPGERLRQIHQLVVPYVDMTAIPGSVKQQFEAAVLIDDRPDGNKLIEAATPAIDNLLQKRAQGQLSNVGLIQEVQAVLVQEARKNTTVTLDKDARGQLRSHGVRSIDGSPSERVYATHMQVVEPEMSATLRAMSENAWPPASYYGLSVGLDDAYELFSQRYTSLPADSLDDWAKREAFFQLVGSTIHPFLDGNSRALIGFLVASTVEKTGKKVQYSPQKMQGIVHDLEEISDVFLRYTQGELSNLAFVEDDWHLRIMMPEIRADYMAKVRMGLEKSIEQGVSGGTKQPKLIDRAAAIIKHAVSE